MNSKVSVALRYAVLVVILAIVVVAVIFAIPPADKNAPGTESNLNNTQITQMDPRYAPAYFPQIPLNESVEVLSNYNATSPDGRMQATRIFASKATVADNFNFYHSFLTKTFWNITGEINDSADPSHRAIFAQNQTGVVNVSISAGQVSGTSVVDISFVSPQ